MVYCYYSTMAFNYFSYNGKVLPISDAKISIADVAYSYGFGVYETIRLHDGISYFEAEHIKRLMDSAHLIDLQHTFRPSEVSGYIDKLVHKNEVQNANLKILLIGAEKPADASLYIQVLNPLYPDRKWYKAGVRCTTYNYERFMPHAKSLNMLQSYLAYREARNAEAYDALLINSQKEITEGSRTNFFGIRGSTIISPPEKSILLGVMRSATIHVAQENGYKLVERPIKLDSLSELDGAFLTSTSSKIMPIKSIGEYEFGGIPPKLSELMWHLQSFLDESKGVLSAV